MSMTREQVINWAKQSLLMEEADAESNDKFLIAFALLIAFARLARENMREQCAKVCEKERAALEENQAVWKENPEFTPCEEYIADWESSACRGEEYAAAIRNLEV